jgi:hypothetical protein
MSNLSSVNHNCPYCGDGMAIASMTCERCHVRIEAVFPMSHIGRLPVEHQRFIEMFILCSGNLNQLAEQVGVSYPTIRSRLDKVIDALQLQIAGPPGPSSPPGDKPAASAARAPSAAPLARDA